MILINLIKNNNKDNNKFKIKKINKIKNEKNYSKLYDLSPLFIIYKYL